jgi:PAS domain-containing protein
MRMPGLNERLQAVLARAIEPGTDVPLRVAELVLEHTLHPTLLVDVDETVLFANAAFAELLGGSERGIGWRLTDFVPLVERDQVSARLGAWRSGGAIGVLRYEHALSFGNRPTVAWSMQALRDSGGKPIAALVRRTMSPSASS